MTYCVGLQVDHGLAFMSDTRTNAGVDNVSTFRKMRIWEVPGERVIVPYRVIFLGFLFLGAIGALEVIWSIADTLNGLMAAPNLIALIALAGVLAREKDAHMATAAAATVPRGDDH